MYTIVKAAISNDTKKIYSVYKYKSCVDEKENKYVETYGLSATNTYECSRVNDVIRNEEYALKMLEAASENSVSVENLVNFTADYLKENNFRELK